MQNIFIPSNAKATHPITGNRKWLEIISEDTIEYSYTASFVDDMTGATLRGFFVDGSLDSLRLEGMATTLYHLFKIFHVHIDNIELTAIIYIIFCKNAGNY